MKDACAVLAFAHLEANVRPIYRLLVTQNQQLWSRKAYQLYLREQVGNAFWGVNSQFTLARGKGNRTSLKEKKREINVGLSQSALENCFFS